MTPAASPTLKLSFRNSFSVLPAVVQEASSVQSMNRTLKVGEVSVVSVSAKEQPRNCTSSAVPLMAMVPPLREQ